jgi:glycosidase
MLATTLLFMYGTPFLYNGEEIGMSNVDYTRITDFKDVSP